MGDKEHLVALIRFGVFEVDARSGEVRKAGVRIKLQDQPFKVLLTLLDHPGEVITREDLRARIWPNESFGDFDHAMNVAIAKLRTALGDSADTPRYVETLHRRGYRFIFPVVPVNGGSAAGSNGKGGTTESNLAAESAAFLASRPSNRSRSVWAAISLLWQQLSWAPLCGCAGASVSLRRFPERRCKSAGSRIVATSRA
jgi:DNA-binding winged helix-turn-helix (wHTH) protein